MSVELIFATKQFGFGLNVLGQSSREKSVRLGQGNIRTGNGTWMKGSVRQNHLRRAGLICNLAE
jgi:hypothetical protein